MLVPVEANSGRQGEQGTVFIVVVSVIMLVSALLVLGVEAGAGCRQRGDFLLACPYSRIHCKYIVERLAEVLNAGGYRVLHAGGLGG